MSPGEVGDLREFTLFPVEPGSYRVRGRRTDGELTSDTPLSPVFELPHPASASSVVPVGFSLVESFGDIEPAYWLPVVVNGEPVVFERGAHWQLSGSGDAVAVSGSDGCNDFQSANDYGPTRYEDGTLVEVHLEEIAQDCGDGPWVAPGLGDRFFVSGWKATSRFNERRGAQPLGRAPRPMSEW